MARMMVLKTLIHPEFIFSYQPQPSLQQIDFCV